MKKLLSLILLSIVLFAVGCDENFTPSEPETWDVEANEGWNVIVEGKVIKLAVKRNNTCDSSPVCSMGCLKHGSFRYVVFDNGQTVSFKHLKDPGLMREGQIGRLYRQGKETDYRYAWYQWIETSSESNSAKKINTVTVSKMSASSKLVILKPSPEPVVESIIESTWQEYDDIKELEAKEPVLIKLDNDIITIGFLTYDKQWKLNTNKNKYQHGTTLTDVVKWKRIDLE